MPPQELQLLDDYFGTMLPPPNTPAWQWCEEHVEISTDSAFPGRYSTELFPMVRTLFDYATNPRTRRVVVLVSAQSSKTLSLLNMLAWKVGNDPCTTMWIMASKDNCEEFLKKRLEPHFTLSPKLAGLWPSSREHKTQRMIQFPRMNLLLRGSNSPIGLQSDPVRTLFCDERREWKDGAINMVRERMITFHNCLEISAGTAGIENAQFHRDFEEGSQTFFYWPCIKCGHEQPFRFGREASPLFKTDRKKGGLVWETNEKTKPGGVWDYDEVRKTVGYECENCGHIYKTTDKYALVKNIRPVHMNPGALPTLVSLHWNAFYMPWSNLAWEELAVQFLRAKAAFKMGDHHPLYTFFTETCGEPWRVPSDKVNSLEILERRGRYKVGESWGESEGKTVKLLTVDVQSGYLVYVIRQYKSGGVSRLVEAGKARDYSDLYAVQVRHNIRPQCVFIDPSYERARVEKECLRYKWNPLEGDEHEEFVQPDPVKDPATGKLVKVRSPWSYVRIDPFRGTGDEGRTLMKRFLWSNPAYMDKLYFYVLRGLTQQWEIPFDVAQEYIDQVMAYERETTQNPDGVVSYKWVHKGRRHDFADCELMQLAAADICYITRAETVTAEPTHTT